MTIQITFDPLLDSSDFFKSVFLRIGYESLISFTIGKLLFGEFFTIQRFFLLFLVSYCLSHFEYLPWSFVYRKVTGLPFFPDYQFDQENPNGVTLYGRPVKIGTQEMKFFSFRHGWSKYRVQYHRRRILIGNEKKSLGQTVFGQGFRLYQLDSSIQRIVN